MVINHLGINLLHPESLQLQQDFTVNQETLFANEGIFKSMKENLVHLQLVTPKHSDSIFNRWISCHSVHDIGYVTLYKQSANKQKFTDWLDHNLLEEAAEEESARAVSILNSSLPQGGQNTPKFKPDTHSHFSLI